MSKPTPKKLPMVHYGGPGWLVCDCGKSGVDEKRIIRKSMDLEKVTCSKCRGRRIAWIAKCDEMADARALPDALEPAYKERVR